MSWFKSAVSKAVEVGNKNNLTRTVKNYADSVVQQAGQAVAEGAKIIQDRIATRNFKSFKQTVKRLEEASISRRGPERVQLMRRWLVALRDVSGVPIDEKEKNSEVHQQSGETKGSPRSHTILYFDSDIGGEPMHFRDVFLHSQALEGITISMILQAPNEEEVSVLLELYEICLTGGKEIHNAIVSSIQDLAKAFSSYEDEVLVKREELLQFTEGAISGLKVNADVRRIDAEISMLKKKIDELEESKSAPNVGDEAKWSGNTASTIEALKETLSHIRACSRLEGLLLQKKAIKSGDTPEIHAQKVDKLQVLSESLSSSSEKAEKRILDNRVQKEDALKFRVTKTSEATDTEKEITDEISGLEKQRDELEAELKKVNISLSAAKARLHNVTEERDQFYEANDQIVTHLKSKEDELIKSIGSCKVERTIISTWINFLKDTWALQTSYSEIKSKEIQDELEKHESYFVNLVVRLLSFYEKELEPSIDRIEKYVENLKSLSEGSGLAVADTEDGRALSPRKSLEEEYLDYEAKIVTIFSVVDNMREQFYAQHGKLSSKEDPKARDLFDKIEKLREEFDSVERPNLELENPKHEPEPLSEERQLESTSLSTGQEQEPKTTSDVEKKVASDLPAVKPESPLDPESELAKLESEFGKMNQDYSNEEISGWEFDELERELSYGDTAPPKK